MAQDDTKKIVTRVSIDKKWKVTIEKLPEQQRWVRVQYHHGMCDVMVLDGFIYRLHKRIRFVVAYWVERGLTNGEEGVQVWTENYGIEWER